MNTIERRMNRWVVISRDEHDSLRALIAKDVRSLFPPGTELPHNKVLHHMDDCVAFDDAVKYPRVFHPSIFGGDAAAGKPPRETWACQHGHTYEACLCHAPGVVHYGQDEVEFVC